MIDHSDCTDQWMKVLIRRSGIALLSQVIYLHQVPATSPYIPPPSQPTSTRKIPCHYLDQESKKAKETSVTNPENRTQNLLCTQTLVLLDRNHNR